MSERQIRRSRERQVERDANHKRLIGRRAAIAVSAAVGTGAVLAAPAAAETFQVNDLDDHDDGDCSASDCTLREAVYDAGDTTAADVVTFAAGLSGEILLDSGTIRFDHHPVDVQGPGAGVLAVSGGGDYQIFYINDAGSTSISGLTLRDGYAYGPVGPESGGAIEVEGTDLTLASLVFDGNRAYEEGGAIQTQGYSLTVTGSVFSGNSTVDEDGGALMIESTEGVAETEVTISDTVFTGNVAAGDAGAIYVDEVQAGVLIERTTLAGNSADDIGGGLVLDGDGSGSLTIDRSTVSGNTASVGGGLFLYGIDEPVTIQNSTVSGNSAEYEGGGIQFQADPDDEDEITIRNSTVARNDAENYGGGINRNPFYTGGTYYTETVAVRSSIAADNTAPDNPDLGEGPSDLPTSFDLGFSLAETVDGATITESPAGSNIIGVDPLLGGLANNGGPTQTHAPALNSPVLDAGIANGLTSDQRGLARASDLALVANRPGSDATDIGSVEIQAADVEAQCQATTVRRLAGTAGDDTVTGTDAAEALFGLAGNDTVSGAGGNDCVNGDEGRDNAKGGPGKDIVKGGPGKDKGSGGGGRDKVKGNAGKDKLKGGGGADKLSGAGGKDRLSGGGGKDRLKGGPGKDKLIGGGGKDRFNCGGGKDRVTAQPKDKVSASCEKVVGTG